MCCMHISPSEILSRRSTAPRRRLSLYGWFGLWINYCDIHHDLSLCCTDRAWGRLAVFRDGNRTQTEPNPWAVMNSILTWTPEGEVFPISSRPLPGITTSVWDNVRRHRATNYDDSDADADDDDDDDSKTTRRALWWRELRPSQRCGWPSHLRRDALLSCPRGSLIELGDDRPLDTCPENTEIRFFGPGNSYKRCCCFCCCCCCCCWWWWCYYNADKWIKVRSLA